MTASAFKFNQLVDTPKGRGYVIGKIEGEKDRYMVQIGRHMPGMTVEQWGKLSMNAGPCVQAEFAENELTPITEENDVQQRRQSIKRRKVE